MYSLLIDGCLDYLEIALIKDEIIIDTSFEVLNKNFVKIFNKNIDELLLKNDLTYSNLSNIYVVNGPGSFTSVKLISLFANTTKYVFKHIKLLGLNTLKWNITNKNELSFLDAKSSLYFISTYWFDKPKAIYEEDIKNIKWDKEKYFYNLDIKKSIFDKWEFNKYNFSMVDFIRPIYIKPAIYDNKKK